MPWDPQTTGQILQAARHRLGWTLTEVEARTGVKAYKLSELERGLTRRYPHEDTQRRLERALGVKLPIPRGEAKKVTVYVYPIDADILDRVVTKFSDCSVSQAVLYALEEWRDHEDLLEAWRKDHGGEI